MQVPESHRDLMEDGERAYACLATVMPYGPPQAAPVWFDAQGDYILINSTKGRTKDRKMRARPAVALQYVQIRGRNTEFSEDGALEHINGSSMKYRGRPWSPVEGQMRVTYRLLPEHVASA